ncbi:MAG: hypothetical protein GF309_15735 [Candidatus Lokiarchaeota archaeon]|nr:hypothetical protein [Candidatus Lokiarchaeota archaeon]
MKKQKMIKYGVNLALYPTRKHFELIQKFGKLLLRMYDLGKDREWKQDLDLYPFTEDETGALQKVTDFPQEYLYKNNAFSDCVTYY